MPEAVAAFEIVVDNKDELEAYFVGVCDRVDKVRAAIRELQEYTGWAPCVTFRMGPKASAEAVRGIAEHL